MSFAARVRVRLAAYNGGARALPRAAILTSTSCTASTAGRYEDAAKALNPGGPLPLTRIEERADFVAFVII